MVREVRKRQRVCFVPMLTRELRPSNAASGAQDLQLEVYSALRKLKILFSLMQVLSQFTWNFEGAHRCYSYIIATLLKTLALTCFRLFAATSVAARACA